MKNRIAHTEKTQFPNRRKRFLINKNLQRTFIAPFLLLGLFCVSGSIVCLWHYSSKEMSGYLYHTHFMPSNPWEILFPVILKINIIFLVLLIISSAMLVRCIFGRFSLRLQSFKTAIEKIGNGDLSVPVSRVGIKSLDKQLQETVIHLNRRVSDLVRIQKEIKAAADTPVYDEKVLKDLERLSISFKNTLSQFNYKEW